MNFRFHFVLFCVCIVYPLSALAIDEPPRGAVRFFLGGSEASSDQKAFQKARIVIAQGITENVIDKYLLSEPSNTGGIEGCVQASRTATGIQFQRFVSKLASIKYDTKVTAFYIESKLKCAELPASGLERILVYKPDGTKYCESQTPIDVLVMQQELENQGIGVYFGERTLDGLLHAQICGGNTGYINRYSIAATDLVLAESLGFRLWAQSNN